MMHLRTGLAFTAFLALTTVLTPSLHADTPGYTITPLGSAQAISRTGLVLGQTGDLWSAATGDETVDAAPYRWGAVHDVNSSGVVVGTVILPDGSSPYGSLPSPQHWVGGAAFSAAGQTTLLPPLAYGPNATADAYAINDPGVVVGISGDGARHAFKAVRWTGGVPQDLSFLLNPAGGSSSATAINNAGQVIITQGNGSFLLTGSRLTTITSSDPAAVSCYGAAINNAGQVAGIMYFADETAKAFIWLDGQMRIAPSLDPSVPSMIGFASINDAGIAVGTVSPLDKSSATAVLWNGSGNLVDMNSLLDPDSGWYLYYAAGINKQGQIIGNGLFNGDPESFLLTPTAVPEPATILLLSAPLLIHRRRRMPAR